MKLNLGPRVGQGCSLGFTFYCGLEPGDQALLLSGSSSGYVVDTLAWHLPEHQSVHGVAGPEVGIPREGG